MAFTTLNKFSSIENSAHVSPRDKYEILEWPRPVGVPTLTHVTLQHKNIELKNPVLMGEYENFNHKKLAILGIFGNMGTLGDMKTKIIYFVQK